MNTKELTELFNRCNGKYFDGKLPLPRFRVSHSRTRLGYMSCQRVMQRKAGLFAGSFRRITKPAFTDFKISISDYYVMTADQLEDVMTHEMIHYSIVYTGLCDTAPHGVIFRGMMDAINRRYGRHITVMTSTKGWQPRIEPKPMSYLVLGIMTRDGTYFLSSVNPSFAGKLELQIRRVREIAEHRWVRTSNDFFRTFPRVRSLRGRRVTKTEYDAVMLLKN